MAPITTASDESNHHELLDRLDMYKIHKAFRNPAWKPPQRRNKNLKQIISEAARREQSLINTQNNSGTSTPTTADGGTALNPNPTQGSQDLSRLVLDKNTKATSSLQPPTMTQQGQTIQIPSYTYTSLAAAPSLKPKQRYCDITGLPARYQDPKSGLRYHDKEIYAVVKTLGTAQVQEYLAARGAHTVLK